MIVKYVNNRGVSVNLNQDPYKLLVSDLLDHEWTSEENSNRIVRFRKKITKKKVNVDVIRSRQKSSKILLNELTDIFEADVIDNKPGRMYIDDNYMTCFLYSGQKENWGTDAIISCEYGLITDHPFWIEEEVFSFGKKTDTTRAATFLDYPHDYPYDYSYKGQQDILINPHYGSCEFEMIVYGPCTNPRIVIAGQVYEVTTKINASEYLIIKSREGTVYRVTDDGTQINEFANKNNEYPLFQKIPAGQSQVSWSGEYGWDITLYIERSEPKWT